MLHSYNYIFLVTTIILLGSYLTLLKIYLNFILYYFIVCYDYV